MKLFPVKLPSLYDEFKKGNFVVNTCGNSFSKITMDQTQEHNNKKIKSVSGYINLVNQEDKKLLEKIELCWPEILQCLESFKGRPVAQGHKEKTSMFVATFNKDCIKVYENILMNPFSTNSQFYKLNLSYIFPDVVSRDSERVFVSGENLYSHFLHTRLVGCSDDLNKKKITKNSLKLPKDSDEVEAEKPRISINEKLINKLRGACNSRSLLAKQVFQGEWAGVPECFVTK